MQGWFFEEFGSKFFWEDWALADLSRLHGKAFGKVIPKILILLIMVVSDIMLQVQGTQRGKQEERGKKRQERRLTSNRRIRWITEREESSAGWRGWKKK